MGIWKDIEVKIRDTLKFSIESVLEGESTMQIGVPERVSLKDI